MKRATIFVFYDKDGIVDSNVEHYLKAIIPLTNHLIIISKGPLNSEGHKSFSHYANKIIFCKNANNDLEAYKAGIEQLGYASLQEYDELILVNDHVFGPFCSLAPYFRTWNRKKSIFGVFHNTASHALLMARTNNP